MDFKNLLKEFKYRALFYYCYKCDSYRFHIDEKKNKCIKKYGCSTYDDFKRHLLYEELFSKRKKIKTGYIFKKL